MFSNSAIFTYEGDFATLEFIKKYLQGSLDDALSNSNQYLSVTRIYQTHTLIYILGSVLFLLIFMFMELINACFENAWKTCCCLCFNYANHLQQVLKSFSNNIYKEIGIEELRTEFKKAKTELVDVQTMVVTGVLPKDEITVRFVKGIQEKLQ